MGAMFTQIETLVTQSQIEGRDAETGFSRFAVQRVLERNYMQAEHPLNILALNWRCHRHPQAGGSEVNLFEQARRWVQAGHKVTVIAANPGRQYAPSRVEVVDGITVRRMGGRFTVYLFAAVYLLLHGRKFDHVLDIANGIPFFSPLFTRTPITLLVHHVHGRQWASEFPYPIAILGQFIERKLAPLPYKNRRVVTVSSSTKDALVEIGFHPSHIQIIYNGVDVVRTESTDTSPDCRQCIAYVGRLKRYKRLNLLIQAVADLRSDFPGIQLDIVGEGDAREELELLVEQLGLQQYVTFHCFVDEQTKYDILRNAYVFVTPSVHEGWGLSVIEANALGCPAVAYNVPGLRESIRHGETGFLADDDVSFRESLALIMGDPGLRERLSVGARKWASQFDWDTSAAEMLLSLYSGMET
jgi:glycosyltransferase involved in cell wall biosynthesis